VVHDIAKLQDRFARQIGQLAGDGLGAKAAKLVGTISRRACTHDAGDFIAFFQERANEVSADETGRAGDYRVRHETCVPASPRP
jgi:hypothetical protein